MVKDDRYPVIREFGTSLSKLNKEQPKDLLIFMVKSIERVYQLVPVKRRPSQEAIIIIAEALIKKYYFLKIEEIEVVFDKGIEGNYGKILDRIGADTLFHWFQEYDIADKNIEHYEKRADDFKKEEHGRNLSVLEMPKFKEMVAQKIDIKPSPTKVTREQLEEHREMIRKQAETIMKNNPKQEDDGNNNTDNSIGNNHGTGGSDRKAD